jgi:hypothetical protein
VSEIASDPGLPLEGLRVVAPVDVGETLPSAGDVIAEESGARSICVPATAVEVGVDVSSERSTHQRKIRIAVGSSPGSRS